MKVLVTGARGAIGRIVFASTAAVYGDRLSRPADESSPLDLARRRLDFEPTRVPAARRP